MPETPSTDPTVLLQRVHSGDETARALLLEVLYQELHQRARNAMRHQPANHTLQPTALVNEVYLRLVGRRSEPWADRNHFLAVAARAMRQILVDHAREKNRDKRSANGRQECLEDLVLVYQERAVDLPALDDALERLGRFDPEMARAVEMRFFAGMTVAEVASQLGLSKRTFERRWNAVKTWLLAEVT